MKTFNLISTTILFLMLCFSAQGQTWDGNDIQSTDKRAAIGVAINPGVKLTIRNTNSRFGIKLDNTFTSTNSSAKHGIYNRIVNNSGGSEKYGIFNTMATGGTGDQYGIYNEIQGNSGSATQYGIYTKMENGGTGDKYGMYVYMNNVSDYSVYARGKMRLYGAFHHEQNMLEDSSPNNWSTHLGFQLGSYTRHVTPKDASGATLFGKSFILDRSGLMKKKIDTDSLAFSVERVGVGGVFDVYGDGKVKIGESITTPGDYKLYVEEGILTEKVKIALYGTTQWADYVFDEDYRLMPLNELNEYVDEHNHLPNIPSSEELVEDGGVELMEMTRLQMEKIEELTLYILELNKKVENLEKELQESNN